MCLPLLRAGKPEVSEAFLQRREHAPVPSREPTPRRRLAPRDTRQRTAAPRKEERGGRIESDQSPAPCVTDSQTHSYRDRDVSRAPTEAQCVHVPVTHTAIYRCTRTAGHRKAVPRACVHSTSASSRILAAAATTPNRPIGGPLSAVRLSVADPSCGGTRLCAVRRQTRIAPSARMDLCVPRPCSCCTHQIIGTRRLPCGHIGLRGMRVTRHEGTRGPYRAAAKAAVSRRTPPTVRHACGHGPVAHLWYDRERRQCPQGLHQKAGDHRAP